MLIPIILVVHISLAIAIVVGFVYRYFLAFINKEYPTIGRSSIFAGTAALVITGTMLAVIGKLPITSLCLDSLGIVVALLAMEFGLLKLSNTLATQKDHIDKQ